MNCYINILRSLRILKENSNLQLNCPTRLISSITENCEFHNKTLITKYKGLSIFISGRALKLILADQNYFLILLLLFLSSGTFIHISVIFYYFKSAYLLISRRHVTSGRHLRLNDNFESG